MEESQTRLVKIEIDRGSRVPVTLNWPSEIGGLRLTRILEEDWF